MKKRILILGLILGTICFGCRKEGIENSYNPKAIELNNKATECVMTQELDKALELFDKAIKIDESYYLPHLNKVNIYIQRKEFDNAIYELETAIRKNNDLTESIFFLGVLYEKKDDVEKSKELYLKSIEIFNSRIKVLKKDAEKEANIINRAMAKKFLHDETYIDDLKLVKKTAKNISAIEMIESFSKKKIMEQMLP